jgi:hypothetical protein
LVQVSWATQCKSKIRLDSLAEKTIKYKQIHSLVPALIKMAACHLEQTFLKRLKQ